MGERNFSLKPLMNLPAPETEREKEILEICKRQYAELHSKSEEYEAELELSKEIEKELETTISDLQISLEQVSFKSLDDYLDLIILRQ